MFCIRLNLRELQVDYQPNEVANLPPPCTPRDVGARVLAQARIEVTKHMPIDVEMEMENSDEEMMMDEEAAAGQVTAEQQDEKAERSAEKKVPVYEPPENVVLPVDSLKVRKDYNPKSESIHP